MIDVFLRWYPKTKMREMLAMAVKFRLDGMPDIRVTTVSWAVVDEPFHINSKKFAEETAKSDIYCVIDDDQLPLREDFFSLGVRCLDTFMDYGMVSGMPLEYLIAGQPYAGTAGAGIVEAHSIGCPYFVRKGTLKHFPDSPIHMYDGDLSKVITDQGLKTGLIRQAVYNHLGYGFSQVEHAQVG